MLGEYCQAIFDEFSVTKAFPISAIDSHKLRLSFVTSSVSLVLLAKTPCFSFLDFF